MYVNLLIAVPAAFAAFRLIANDPHPQRPKIDWRGAALACSGLFAIVFGFSEAERDSFSATSTIVSLTVGVLLIIGFVLSQRRGRFPLLPPPHRLEPRARRGPTCRS